MKPGNSSAVRVSPRPEPSRLRVSAATHQGKQRENNEDCFHADAARGIFLVVDGMGGEAAGERAAATACQQIRLRLESPTASPARRVREAITLANNQIYEAAQSNPEWLGMGCVLTVALVNGPQIVVGHVGDTRLYKLLHGVLTKVTHDHSPVGQREDAGEITEQEAMRHPRRNLVFRDVGTQPRTPDDVEFVDVMQVPFEREAALLMCSDGLTDQVTAERVRQLMEQHAGQPQAAAEALIAEANRMGGKDNVTVLIVENEGYPASGSEPLPAPEEITSRRRRPRAWHLLLGGVLLFVLAVLVLGDRWRMVQPVPDPTAVMAGPATLRVGPASAFATIAQAVAQAKEGDTVLVAPGEYRESLQIRQGITLRSERLREAALLPPIGGAEANPAITWLGTRTGRLSGFRIVGGPVAGFATGISVRDSSVEIDSMDVSGTRMAAVEMIGSSIVTLASSRLVDNLGTGVTVQESSQATLLHNEIRENGHQSTNPQPGVMVHPPAQARLLGNVVADNGAEAVWKQHADNDEATMLQNRLSGGLRAGRRLPPVKWLP